jgi:hypothetical protein
LNCFCTGVSLDDGEEEESWLRDRFVPLLLPLSRARRVRSRFEYRRDGIKRSPHVTGFLYADGVLCFGVERRGADVSMPLGGNNTRTLLDLEKLLAVREDDKGRLRGAVAAPTVTRCGMGEGVKRARPAGRRGV